MIWYYMVICLYYIILYGDMLITTIKNYAMKRRPLEEKSLGWLLGWWLQAAPSSACRLSQGWLGLDFWQAVSPWARLVVPAFLSFWVWGAGSCASHGSCHSSCQPWLPGLPALPSTTPVCLGTLPLGMLAFPVRQPRFWGMCVIYVLNIVAEEEFNPSLERSTCLCLNCTNILLWLLSLLISQEMMSRLTFAFIFKMCLSRLPER